MRKPRLILITLIAVILITFYLTGSYEYLTLKAIQNQLQWIQEQYRKSPGSVTTVFMGLYILITSLSIPGAIILTLLSGAIFGTLLGTFYVSISSCAGACIAFLMSRYLFRDLIMERFEYQYRRIDERLKREGTLYLFSLRMVPISPFVVINLLMGLTKMNLFTFAWVTFFGMLPGTFVYVFAGRNFAELKSLKGIMTWPVLLSLTLMGLLPFITRMIISHIHRRKMAHA